MSGRASTPTTRSVARTRATSSSPAGTTTRELADILAASDVLVLPSVREQFGQVIVEAMACGVPPIAVDAFGPADIVDHGQTGWLVEPDDVVSLANALVEAVNRPGERRRRGANAARRRARALRLARARPTGRRGLRRRR